MEDNKDRKAEQGGEGRTHNQEGQHGVENYQPALQSSDISGVDQQEGAMHHGTTGGNFSEESKELRSPADQDTKEGQGA